MNRNQRIVVSIVGIIIVTLALIGITYAYFMTKIIGNSTSTSISGTLANLELTYGDGKGIVTKDNIMPGNKIEKTFTVKNTGSVKVENYAVVFESLTNTLTRKGDLVYTLTCTSSDSNPCNGVTNLVFPSTNSPIILNSIEPTVTHSYTLTVTYKNLDNIDQSDDMGKKFEAKVNIKDGKDIEITDLPYTLAYNVLNNSKSGINGTTYKETPSSRPGIDSSDISQSSVYNSSYTYFDASYYYIYGDNYTFDEVKGVYNLTNPQIILGSSAHSTLIGKYVHPGGGSYGEPSNWATTLESIYKVTSVDGNKVYYEMYRPKSTNKSIENILSKMNDDLGVSYYYRGGVEDNYINFANMCWRIVRIEGDGSTKIVLEDSSLNCEDSYSKSYATISGNLDSFLSEKLSSYKSLLKYDTWKKEKYYPVGRDTFRNNPLESVFGNIISSNNAYIGSLNATEVSYAGFAASSETKANYLYNESDWWLYANNGWNDLGVSYEIMSCYSCKNRPAVTLKKDVAVSGQGTKSDPYVVQ